SRPFPSWAHQPLNMVGPLLKGFSFLLLELMPDINARHPGQRAAAVIQYLFNYRDADAELCKIACARPSQVVQGPATNAACLIQSSLGVVEAVYRLRRIVAEHIFRTDPQRALDNCRSLPR